MTATIEQARSASRAAFGEQSDVLKQNSRLGYIPTGEELLFEAPPKLSRIR